MRWLAVCIVLSAAMTGQAVAGAWTLDRSKLQIFTGVTVSAAGHRFGDTGSLDQKVAFNKILVQNWSEYGLTDATTIFVAPEYVLAQSDMTGAGLEHVQSSSVEAGVRILLLSHVGMVSLQVSGKSAGAFNMAASSSGRAGTQFETRLLYGHNFRFFRRDGFFDLEAAKRWISPPRPDEVDVDGTLGLWVTHKDLVMVQSFNCVTDGQIQRPYAPYALYKAQFSLVHRLSRRWSLQSGYFMSYAGRNIVKEAGFVSALWFRT